MFRTGRDFQNPFLKTGPFENLTGWDLKSSFQTGRDLKSSVFHWLDLKSSIFQGRDYSKSLSFFKPFGFSKSSNVFHWSGFPNPVQKPDQIEIQCFSLVGIFKIQFLIIGRDFQNPVFFITGRDFKIQFLSTGRDLKSSFHNWSGFSNPVSLVGI